MNKIAFLLPTAGIVYRGAERTADDFMQYYPGDVTIVSLAGCRNKEADFPNLKEAHQIYIKITKRLHILDILSSILLRKGWRYIGKYNYFSAHQWLDWMFSKRMIPFLSRLSPSAIINEGGMHSARAISKYSRIHDIPVIGIYGGAASWNMLHFARWNQGVFLAHYPAQLEIMRKKEPKIKTVFIPLGVNTDLFFPHVPSISVQMEVKDLERPIFLSTSALETEKRIDFIIEAISILKKGSLLLVGGGTQKDLIISKANQILGKSRFRYVGAINTKEIERLVNYYRIADVFFLASINEPFGNVLLEAMACGKPVVACCDKTRKWIVKEAGILTDVTDLQASAIALQKAAETDWGDNPRKRAEYFSLQRVLSTWAALIESLINRTTDFDSPFEIDLYS